VEWILSTNIIGGFHKLAWAQRITYLFFIYAVLINGWASRERSVDKPWRRLYLFKGLISFIAWLYYTLLVTEIISARSYIDLARWIQPLIVVCLFTSAQLHKWEVGNLRERKELEKKLDVLTRKDDDD
jgi:hypothetical protein